MKVTVLQEHLAHAMSTAGRIVSNRPQMPILSHVYLKATEAGLELGATNLEIGWRTVLGAKVDEQGEITVPARTLLELVGNVASGRLTLTVEDVRLQVSGVGVKAQVNGTMADEFPALPDFHKEQAISLPPKTLKQAFERVVFAAATDESRPVLTAVLVRLNGSQLELVGTDGFRLSRVSWEAKGADWKSQDFLIPAKSIIELGRLLDEGAESVELAMVENGNQVVFKVDDTELSTRLVSGTFPDFKKIIPEAGTTNLMMETREFLRAMKLSAVFARESANIVKLSVEEGRVVVSANAAQVGENEAVVQAQVDGPGGQIAFNYRYILDLLNVVNTTEIGFEMKGPLDAGLWRTKKGKDEMDFSHVIMPVRLEE